MNNGKMLIVRSPSIIDDQLPFILSILAHIQEPSCAFRLYLVKIILLFRVIVLLLVIYGLVLRMNSCILMHICGMSLFIFVNYNKSSRKICIFFTIFCVSMIRLFSFVFLYFCDFSECFSLIK